MKLDIGCHITYCSAPALDVTILHGPGGLHHVIFQCGFMGYNFKVINHNAETYFILIKRRLSEHSCFTFPNILKVVIKQAVFPLTSGQIHLTSG